MIDRIANVETADNVYLEDRGPAAPNRATSREFSTRVVPTVQPPAGRCAERDGPGWARATLLT